MTDEKRLASRTRRRARESVAVFPGQDSPIDRQPDEQVGRPSPSSQRRIVTMHQSAGSAGERRESSRLFSRSGRSRALVSIVRIPLYCRFCADWGHAMATRRPGATVGDRSCRRSRTDRTRSTSSAGSAESAVAAARAGDASGCEPVGHGRAVLSGRDAVRPRSSGHEERADSAARQGSAGIDVLDRPRGPAGLAHGPAVLGTRA